jgi:hypothetical protein
VPEVKAAMENGRRLKELISEAGLHYTQALKETLKRRASETAGKDNDA